MLNKPLEGSCITQDEHNYVEFGLFKLTKRVKNIETKMLTKLDIMNMVSNDEFQMFKGYI